MTQEIIYSGLLIMMIVGIIILAFHAIIDFLFKNL